MKNGIYIYGVISREAGKTSSPQDFGKIGIGDKPSKVMTVGFKDLVAVISKGPFMIYDSLAKEKTVKDLVTHQFVIEKVMEGFTIIPVKFGTMVATLDEVIKFLEKGYFVLRNTLRKMEGKIELDVVATFKMPETVSKLYSQSQKIRRKQEEIAAKGNKAALEDKIALGKLVEQALETKKVRLGRLIWPALKKEGVDACLHNLATEDMVFNAAFLVDREQEEFFNKAVNLLDQKFEGILNFRLVGPLPPYSFSTILVERLSSVEVEEAKKTLRLNGEVTATSVRQAYHSLAKEFHPDKHKGAVPLHFDLVNSAYKKLINFLEKGYFHVDIYHWEEGR